MVFGGQKEELWYVSSVDLSQWWDHILEKVIRHQYG
jgi:hypothetical protein